MAIILYEKGDLSSGFYGYRVVVAIRGKHYQKWFTLKHRNNVPFDIWHHYQHTRARYYEARWLARSAACQYIDFISTNAPTTKPLRGLGFHGMTIGIGRGNRCHHDQCYFHINKKGSATRIWITEDRTFSAAWEMGIRSWGKLYEIREKDIQQKLNNPPSPEIFKKLRVHMNENEGKDFPPSVLRHVFAEKRLQISNKRAQSALDKPVSDDEILDFYSNLEREIAVYTESAQKQ